MDRVRVLLDSISNSDGETPLARCIYFHIEVEESMDAWQLGVEGASIPFFMVGLAGVLLAPTLDVPRFREVRQLLDLIKAIEAREGQSVETADVWFPARLLPHPREIRRGDVLRVERELFLTATQVRAGGLDVVKTFSNFRRKGAIERSPEETRVFADWSKIQISEFGHWQNNEEPPRWRDRGQQGGFAEH
jgi:hypothetical protein